MTMKTILSLVVHKVARERAVLVGSAIALLTLLQDGEWTWEQARYIAVGVVIRFLVVPSNEATSNKV